MALAIGEPAPAFIAPDQDGKIHRLEEFRGRWLLLYFYPKDDTPGCTKEACNFRDKIEEMRPLVEIVGVSPDTVESHRRFADKYGLTFTLLADPERQILAAYGVGSDVAKRASFLIDSRGIIRKIYDKADPETHAEELLGDLRSFQAGG